MDWEFGLIAPPAFRDGAEGNALARRTPAARLALPGGSAATRCEGRRFRLPTSHRRSGRPDSERFKSIPRTSAAVCGHSRSRQAAILSPRPGQRREIMMHPHLPGPRPLAVPGIGFPQNISIASDVVDRAAFGDLLDIHRGASKPPIDRIQPVLRTRPRCATVVPRRYGMERQQLKLMDMIAAIVGALDKREIFQSVISHTGRQHAQFGVERSHFAAFGDALIWGPGTAVWPRIHSGSETSLDYPLRCGAKRNDTCCTNTICRRPTAK